MKEISLVLPVCFIKKIERGLYIVSCRSLWCPVCSLNVLMTKKAPFFFLKCRQGIFNSKSSRSGRVLSFCFVFFFPFLSCSHLTVYYFSQGDFPNRMSLVVWHRERLKEDSHWRRHWGSPGLRMTEPWATVLQGFPSWRGRPLTSLFTTGQETMCLGP